MIEGERVLTEEQQIEIREMIKEEIRAFVREIYEKCSAVKNAPDGGVSQSFTVLAIKSFAVILADWLVERPQWLG